MIQMGSKIKVLDNSGAQEIECIRVLNKSKSNSCGKVGDVFVCAVKRVSPSSTKVKKGDIVKAVLVTSKKPYTRKDGTTIRFDENGAVLISNQGEPYGTRLLFSIDRSIKVNYSKLVSLAPEVI